MAAASACVVARPSLFLQFVFVLTTHGRNTGCSGRRETWRSTLHFGIWPAFTSDQHEMFLKYCYFIPVEGEAELIGERNVTGDDAG